MSAGKRPFALLVAIVALVAIGSAGLWRVQQPAGDAPRRHVAPSPIAARITAIYAEPGGPAIVTLRIFNHAARQAAVTNAALGAAASNAPREAVTAIELPLAPDGWSAAVRFRDSLDGAPLPASDIRVVTRPDASVHVLGAEDAVHARFEISPRGVAALGGRVMAAVSAAEWRIASNTVVLDAPVDLRERRIARGRVAEARGDSAALAAAGASLVEADAADPWGHWYLGLAREAQGDRAAALQAYEAAAARLSPASGLQEPPVDLFRRIVALRQE